MLFLLVFRFFHCVDLIISVLCSVCWGQGTLLFGLLKGRGELLLLFDFLGLESRCRRRQESGGGLGKGGTAGLLSFFLSFFFYFPSGLAAWYVLMGGEGIEECRSNKKVGVGRLVG